MTFNIKDTVASYIHLQHDNWQQLWLNG